MRGSMTNEEQAALIKAEFGNIDEYLGIAVTDRATGQIRLTKAKQQALKAKCAAQGYPYFEVKTVDDLMRLEMPFFSPESTRQILVMFQEYLAAREAEDS